MGLLKGSISYTKFFVRGEVPEGAHDRFLEAIQLRAFTPLTVDEEADERVGWAPLETPYAPEMGFDYTGVFFNDYLNLAFRVDRWRFPGPVVRALFTKLEKAHLEAKGRERLTKREKDELKALVARKLRKQFSPTIQVVELSWNLTTGVLRFASQSTKVHEQLHELFEKTFSLKLLAASPFASALYAGLPEARLEALGSITPADFAAAGA